MLDGCNQGSFLRMHPFPTFGNAVEKGSSFRSPKGLFTPSISPVSENIKLHLIIIDTT